MPAPRVMRRRSRSAAQTADHLPLAHALVLGLLQGPTELLPVSSSAHTTLVPFLAGWSYRELDPELRKAFEVTLHMGAGIALAVALRAELLEETRKLDRRRAGLIAASIGLPAIAGLTLRHTIERRLGGPRSIAAGLIAGSAAMAFAELRNRPGVRARDDAGAADGLALGVAQAVALMPGVSRSGATLTAARLRGFSRGDGQALSWHAALPVILGAGALTAERLARRGVPAGAGPALALGGAGALGSTLASARLLRRRESRASVLGFCLYRCLLALTVIGRLRAAHNRTE